jgi:Phosphatidate phosphatase APP1, catalytic domain
MMKRYDIIRTASLYLYCITDFNLVSHTHLSPPVLFPCMRVFFLVLVVAVAVAALPLPLPLPLPLLLAVSLGNLTQKILANLAALSADKLNEVLKSADLNRLVGTIDNHLVGDNNRDALIKLLFVTRVADIHLTNRFNLIHALQKRGHWGKAENAGVTSMFLATEGDELMLMKDVIERRASSKYDIHALVYESMDESHREKVLKHFAEQAKHASEKWHLIKFLSDIDDTLYATLHDSSFPVDTVYPGIMAIYRAAQAGHLKSNPAEVDNFHNLAFLTARPKLIEAFTRKTLLTKDIKGAVALSGTARALLSHDKMAAKKLDNFKAYHSLFPECKFVFVGDSGQGDVTLAQEMVKLPGIKDSVVLTGAHDVRDESDKAHTSASERESLLEKGVVIFDSYVEFAVKLEKKGVISKGSLAFVAERTAEVLRTIKYSTKAQATARFAEFRAALKGVEAAIPNLRTTHPTIYEKLTASLDSKGEPSTVDGYVDKAKAAATMAWGITKSFVKDKFQDFKNKFWQ